MHMLTQSAVLRALGWSLFNSIWQMSILWLLYVLLIRVFNRASAHIRHGLAFLLLSAGAAWTVYSFFSNWGNEDAFFTAFSIRPVFLELMNQGLPYFSCLYLGVLVFLFLRTFNYYLHSRQLKRTGLSKIQPQLKLFTEETGRLMGIRKQVRIWLSSLVDGPVTMGWLKPVILIPLATINNLSPEQVEAILVHELAHIKRNDYILHLGLAALEMLFFFNPFAHWFIREIKKEREHCCDDLVMQLRPDPRIYASALLSLARERQNGLGQLALAAGGDNEKLLLQRVKRILGQPGKPRRAGSWSLLLLLLALAVLLFFLPPPRTATPSSGQAKGTPATVNFLTPASVGPPAFLEFAQVRILIPLHPASPMPMPIKLPGIDRKEKNTLIARKPETPAAAPLPVAAPEDAETSELVSVAATGSSSVVVESATLVQRDNRAYSISTTSTAPGNPATRTNDAASPAPDAQKQAYSSYGYAQGQPYVPNASWSSSYIEDTCHPEVQLAYLQATAARELVLEAQHLQIRLQQKLVALQRAQRLEKLPSLRLEKQWQEEQRKLQQDFLQKQRVLEKRLEKLGSRLTIVYI